MRVLRVVHQGHTFYASFTDNHLQCLNKALGFAEPIPLASVAVAPPVMPTKIICAAYNYRSHAEEHNRPLPEEPMLFLKPPSTIIGTGQPIMLPWQSRQVDYEAELALVIGKQARNVSIDKAAEHIFGYACANDVTARDLQRRDGQWARSKGFDTFCPIGPWIETQVEDLGSLGIRTLINGKETQTGSTAEMVHSPLELVSFASHIMTLLPGDVILTGTPGGVGRLNPGDEVRVEIDRVGVLINPVTSQAQAAAERPTGPVQ